MSYSTICDEVKELLKQRASNYDGTSAEDLYELLPERIKGNSKAIILFLQGCPELGIEPAEVMHIISEKNGGIDAPWNLMWGPRDINRRIGGDNMTPEDIAEVKQANEEAIDSILRNLDLIPNPDCEDPKCPDTTTPDIDDLHTTSPIETDELAKEFANIGPLPDIVFNDIREEMAELIGDSMLENAVSYVPIASLILTGAVFVKLNKKLSDLDKKSERDELTQADKLRKLWLTKKLMICGLRMQGATKMARLMSMGLMAEMTLDNYKLACSRTDKA